MGGVLPAEHVRGTVVTFDFRAPDFAPEYDTILAEAIGYLRHVDAWFSTYRVHTPITKYRNGLIELSRLNQVAALSSRTAAS